MAAAAYKPLTPSTADIDYPDLYKAMSDIYITTRDVLIAIKMKEDEKMENLIKKQGAAINAFNRINLDSYGSTVLSSRKVKNTCVKKSILLLIKWH